MASALGPSIIPHTILVIGALLLLCPSASARPCKTLLISYSFSIEKNPNPNPNLNLPSSQFLVVTSTRTYFHPRPSFLLFDDQRFRDGRGIPALQRPQLEPSRHHHLPQRYERSENPLGWFDLRSVRDRTVDILSVVLALLFGVGCGALTAATMFLVWSVCSNNRGDYDGEASEEDEEDLNSIKKMGYVKIADDEKIPEPVKA